MSKDNLSSSQAVLNKVDIETDDIIHCLQIFFSNDILDFKLKFRRGKIGYIYICDLGDVIKFGRSATEPTHRFKDHQSRLKSLGLGGDIKNTHFEIVDRPNCIENALCNAFDHKRVSSNYREWIKGVSFDEVYEELQGIIKNRNESRKLKSATFRKLEIPDDVDEDDWVRGCWMASMDDRLSDIAKQNNLIDEDKFLKDGKIIFHQAISGEDLPYLIAFGCSIFDYSDDYKRRRKFNISENDKDIDILVKADKCNDYLISKKVSPINRFFIIKGAYMEYIRKTYKPFYI